MTIALQQQWSNSGSTGNTPSCTVSGAKAGNLLVAFCEVREELVSITSHNVSTTSVSAGWVDGQNANFNNLNDVAMGHRTATGDSNDDITFTVVGPSSLYGWSVVVYEFNFTVAGYSYASSDDSTADTTWDLPPDDWPNPSGQPAGLALVIGSYAVSTSGNTSSAYNRTNNPNGFTWDATWNNLEKTVVYSSTYYYKYSIGYVLIDSPSALNEPGSAMTFGGSNVDATVTLWLVGEQAGVAGGMMQFNF